MSSSHTVRANTPEVWEKNGQRLRVAVSREKNPHFLEWFASNSDDTADTDNTANPVNTAIDKSLLELKGTFFLPDWQPPLIFVWFTSKSHEH